MPTFNKETRPGSRVYLKNALIKEPSIFSVVSGRGKRKLLSPVSFKLLMALLSCIDVGDSENTVFSVKKTELMRTVFGNKKRYGSEYGKLEKAVKTLNGVKGKSGSLLFTSVSTSSSSVTFSISPDFSDLLFFRSEGNFTVISLSDILALRSSVAMMLYLFIMFRSGYQRQHEQMAKADVSSEELKKMLCCGGMKTSVFLFRVLKKARDRINGLSTEIRLTTVRAVKHGRKTDTVILVMDIPSADEKREALRNRKSFFARVVQTVRNAVERAEEGRTGKREEEEKRARQAFLKAMEDGRKLVFRNRKPMCMEVGVEYGI